MITGIFWIWITVSLFTVFQTNDKDSRAIHAPPSSILVVFFGQDVLEVGLYTEHYWQKEILLKLYSNIRKWEFVCFAFFWSHIPDLPSYRIHSIDLHSVMIESFLKQFNRLVSIRHLGPRIFIRSRNMGKYGTKKLLIWAFSTKRNFQNTYWEQNLNWTYIGR